MRHHPSFAMTLIYCPYEQSYDILHRKLPLQFCFGFSVKQSYPETHPCRIQTSPDGLWMYVRERCPVELMFFQQAPFLRSAHEQRFRWSFLSQQWHTYLAPSSHEHKAQLVQGAEDCVVSGSEKKRHLPLPKQGTVRGLISTNTQNISREACHIPDTCT